MPRRDRSRRAVALLFIAATAGCYHYRVAAPAVANANEPIASTKWSLLWGTIQNESTDTSCICLNNGIKEVTASTNFGYVMLSIASLGIAVPIRMEYVCGKPPPGTALPPPAAGQCPNIVPAATVPNHRDDGSF
ncbi:hypothetical protein LZC95_34355 [Pendulispora brunnea]|uniref:Lipoprotein n=1 Tax=Pendulispora brunnea TaxID=2905690 RepID=A0ABZ2JYE7_9BACT